MNTTQVDSGTLDRSAPDEPEELALVDGPAPDRAAWVAAVDAVLRKARRLDDAAPPGAGVEALTWTTPDGIAVPPLYTAADVADLADVGVPGRRPFVRGDRRARRGARRLGRPAPGTPNRTRPPRTRRSSPTSRTVPRRSGSPSAAPAPRSRTCPAVLDGVLLDLAPVVLEAADPDVGAAAAQAYLDLGAARVGPAQLRGTLGLDPIGVRARTGSGPDVESVVPLALRASREFPLVRALVVDGLPVHVAGGSDAQELGYLLSAGVAYLRALTAAGLGVDAAARLLELRLAATAEQFPTIAKLRAARRLWARVLEVSGADPATAPCRARRRLADDVHPPRPVREPAARHPRRLRRRGRRRGRRHGGAVRRRARGVDAVLPPDRPQHPVAAGHGGAPGAGDRPGGRVVVRRVADRRARPRRLGLLPGARGRGRGGGGARLRAGRGAHRRRPRGPGARTSRPAAPR